MTQEAPRTHRQFRRVEARYRGAVSPGWYRADLGDITPFVTVPVWVYSTWAPFEVNLIGSKSDEYILLVDNTYVSSFAFNLAKIELGAQLFPDDDDYADLMVGNIKKYIAEQQYITIQDGQSMQWVIEYLFEYNGRNRALDRRIRQQSDGVELLHLILKCTIFSLLLHEVGHVAYGVSDYRDRERDTINRHIESVVGAGHTLKRLEEEVFCDIFSMVNAIGLFNRNDGWDPGGLGSVCLYALLSALMCIKTRDLVLAAMTAGSTVSLDPTQDVLMARYEVAARAVRLSMREDQAWFRPARRSVSFTHDTLDLRARWRDALKMPVRDPESRNLATILASAFAEPQLGGFDYVMGTLNQISRVSDLSIVEGGADIRRTE